MSKKTIRTALIGCGRISAAHFEALRGLPEFSLIGLCDSNEEKAQSAGAANTCDITLDYTTLPFANLDLVSICTPNYLHYPMALYCLERGVNVLIEKPITLDVAHLEELERIAQKKNCHIFPVLQVRFNPAVQVVKQTIKEGKLGRVFSGNLIMHWNRPQKYFDEGGWRGKKELDGGTFINQGIHYLDLLVWFLGPVKSVYAIADTLNHTIEVEDHVSAVVRFKSGAVITIEFNVNTYPKNLECSIFIQGEKGSIKIGGSAANELTLWEVEGVPRPEIAEGIAPNVYAGGMYQGSCPNHYRIYETARDVLLRGVKVPAVTSADAKETLKVVQAIYESSKLGSPISL